MVFFFFFFFYLVLLLVPLTIIFLKTRASTTKPLPPGPKPWPIIGNLLALGQKPHVSLQSFSKLHGPLISLRLGSQLLVVASSPAAATEILKTHDRPLSGRFVPKLIPHSMSDLDHKSIVWNSDCNNDTWKKFRSMFRTQVFSPKAIQSHGSVRERKATQMVEFIRNKLGQELNIGEVVFTVAFDSLSNLTFSRDCIGFEETEMAHKFKSLIWRLLELAMAPNAVDFFPILGNLDPQGLRRKSDRTNRELFSVWKSYVKERREIRGREKPTNDDANADDQDILDVFLDNQLDDDQIDWLFLELFIAGTDTNSVTIEWAMTELMRNKGAMNKLIEELKTVLSKGKPLKESDVHQLPYLNAVVKETLRLHAPAPLLGPRRAPETLEVMNYTIPEGARIMVNVWAIARDPAVWGDDALSFKPERFLDSNVDFKGQDFEFLPFGAGRRLCPGIPLATRQIPLLLAALVSNFEWGLPDGEEAATASLDMEEKFGLTLNKKLPLILVPSA